MQRSLRGSPLVLLVILLCSCGDPHALAHKQGRVIALSLKVIYEAQFMYKGDYKKDGAKEFAQSVRDLYYGPTSSSGNIELIEKSIADADATVTNPTPSRGYLYKILKGDKEGSYVDPNGKMTYGYAIIAYPAKYEVGLECFLSSSKHGTFSKDCGPDTRKICEEMTVFNPDDTWSRCEEGPP